MREAAISVKDLHISYRLLRKVSFKRSVMSLFSNKMMKHEAVKGISFEVEKGKILGIVGKNGSGKSTLLRALAGIFSADAGEVDLHGHSISLLSIGVGFNPKLSGYDNIILSGMLLGFSESEIKNKIDDIIAFSELGDFIYKPVRTYSSGMHSKLAFSITAVLETDITLIDEVLSVGDIKFKEKSYNKMKEIISDENRTVLIVSHSSQTIQELCDEVLWLHEGHIKMQDKPEVVIPLYEEYMRSL